MADQVTPDKSPEAIEREMFQTRESITEKVAALESQVVGSVQSAADTLSSTVDAVKSLVSGAPEAVSDTVKQATAAVSDAVRDTFDITGHVRRHPWTAVGASALLGCLTGWLVSRGRGNFTALAQASPPMPSASASSARSLADDTPGVLDGVMGVIGDKVKDLVRTALDTVAVSLKEQIQTGVPKLVGDAASRLTDTGTAPAANGSPFAGRFDARARL